MLLAVDIGNSSITVGAFREGEEPIFTMGFSALEPRSADEYANTLLMAMKVKGIDPSEIRDGAISSVVPPLTPLLAAALYTLCNRRPLELGAGVRTGISIRTDSPAEVGADIIANAAAACCEQGAIIVDFGTATTVFAVNQKKELLGGAILPGIRSSAESLRSATAQLPAVPLQVGKEPIGRNTADCIANGVVLGQAFAVDGFVRQYRGVLGGDPKLLATGDLAPLILPHSGLSFEQDPYLTLKGLRKIYEKTRKTKVS